MLIIKSIKPWDAKNTPLKEGDRITFHKKDKYLTIARGEIKMKFQHEGRGPDDKFLLPNDDYFEMLSFICSISGLGHWEVKNTVEIMIFELAVTPKVFAIKTFKSLSGARHFIFKADLDEVLSGGKELLTIFKKVGGNKNEAKRVVNSTPLERDIDDNEEVIETAD